MSLWAPRVPTLAYFVLRWLRNGTNDCEFVMSDRSRAAFRRLSACETVAGDPAGMPDAFR